jgi:uncharacterized OB-fold protein
MVAYNKPIPEPDPHTKPFWEGAKRGVLMLQRCLDAVQHRAFGAWADEVPFVTAYIDLNEGDRMFTVLRGVDPAKPDMKWVGARVRVEFEPATEDVHIPFWRVVGA